MKILRGFILGFMLLSESILGSICQDKTVPGITMVTLSIPLKTQNGAWLTKLRCHRDMQVPLDVAFACIKLAGAASDLRTTGGCFCYRNIAGTTRLSKHAQGLAIDINPGGKISRQVVECFESAGFKWGGRFSNPDPMHFELRR